MPKNHEHKIFVYTLVRLRSVAMEYLDLHGIPECSGAQHGRIGDVARQSCVVVLVSDLTLHVRLHQIQHLTHVHIIIFTIG